MKKITITIINNKITFDFEGFVGHDCQAEEQKIIGMLNKLGVIGEKESSIPKAEAEPGTIASNNRIRQR